MDKKKQNLDDLLGPKSGKGASKKSKEHATLIVPTVATKGFKKQSELDKIIPVTAPDNEERQETRKRQRQEKEERARLEEDRRTNGEAAPYVQAMMRSSTIAAKKKPKKEAGEGDVIAYDDDDAVLAMEVDGLNEDDDDDEDQHPEKPETFAIDTMNESVYAKGITDKHLDDWDASTDTREFFKQGFYPVDTLVQWATLNGREPLENCEFAFVVNGTWQRSHRLRNANDLRVYLTKRCPETIHVGPVHASSETPGESARNLDLRRPLVFDVDMEDTDPVNLVRGKGYVRNCPCVGQKRVCSQGCWFYLKVFHPHRIVALTGDHLSIVFFSLKVAVKCITFELRESYRAQFIVPIFSGGRGVHVWCLDANFLEWSEDQRKSLIERFKALGKPWEYRHPYKTQYLMDEILKPAFDIYCVQTGLIKHAIVTHLIWDICRTKGLVALDSKSGEIVNETDPVFAEELIEAVCLLSKCRSQEVTQAWMLVCSVVHSKYPGFEEHVVFALLFPRLDERVTIESNHCVKAPFVIHSATKRCCVPIPDIDTWKPDDAPRISDFVQRKDDPGSFYEERQRAKPVSLVPYEDHLKRMLKLAYPPIVNVVRGSGRGMREFMQEMAEREREKAEEEQEQEEEG